jgi:hypothetical protein
MEKLQNVLKILDGKPQGKIHFVYLHIDWMTANWFSVKQDLWVWSGFNWLRTGSNGGLL